MKAFLWAIYYIVLNWLTQMDTTEADVHSNLISNSMGFSLTLGHTTIYLTILCIINFLPIIYTLTKKGSDFYQLRQYVIVRSNSWYFHRNLQICSLRELCVLISTKVVAELLICARLLVQPRVIELILKTNAMYITAGLLIIGWMELLKVLFQLDFKKIFAILIIVIAILQYLNHRATLLDTFITPISWMTITAFQMIFILRLATVTTIFGILYIIINVREEKRGIL